MATEPNSRTTPGGAFGSIAMGVALFGVFGLLTNPIQPFWRWVLLFFGTSFIWYGIIDLLRLGGGWIAWGVGFMLTLGLGSGALVAIALLTALK